MAQTGFTPILIYASGTSSNTPAAGNLTNSALGAELAINYADGILFYKDSGGVVQQIATKNATAGIFGGTGAITVPAGTQAQRPAVPTTGMFRFNSDTTRFEGYNGSVWGAVGGGATGGGNDEIFVENGQVVTTNYTIPVGRNAMSTGPITINSGVTVTISTGSVWALL